MLITCIINDTRFFRPFTLALVCEKLTRFLLVIIICDLNRFKSYRSVFFTVESVTISFAASMTAFPLRLSFGMTEK